MESFAAWLGTFVGAVLKQCAPVLADILAEGIKRAFQNTVEDSKAPSGLADSLRARIAAGVRDQNVSGQQGNSGPNP